MYIIYAVIPLGDAGQATGFYAESECPEDCLVDEKEPKLTWSPIYAKQYKTLKDTRDEINYGVFNYIHGSMFPMKII